MAALVSRRAGDDEVAAELALLYPAAPACLAAAFDRPAPRADDGADAAVDQVPATAWVQARDEARGDACCGPHRAGPWTLPAGSLTEPVSVGARGG
jgi:hypothetical protein